MMAAWSYDGLVDGEQESTVAETMRAAWYERQGPASEVLRVGETSAVQPAAGEVRVRVAVSGVHIGDLGKRAGWWGSRMPFRRVVPHGDGAGVIDRVGAGADPDRVGQRVWVFLAQSYRPFGTAAELVTVPAGHAVPLPDEIPFDQGACLGIPGITGHRAVFADGPVTGFTVVVTGAVGGVGRAAVAVARRGGARVIAVVRRSGQVEAARRAGAHDVVDLSGGDGAGGDLADQLLTLTGGRGVDRLVEVAFDQHVAAALRALVNGGVIAAYATHEAEPTIPFWELGFKNITIRHLSNDDFPEPANQAAAADLTAAARAGALRYPIAARFPLSEIARAHGAVATLGATGRVLIDL